MLDMVAYWAETALGQGLTPYYARTEHEGRALIREVLLTSAAILKKLGLHNCIIVSSSSLAP